MEQKTVIVLSIIVVLILFILTWKHCSRSTGKFKMNCGSYPTSFNNINYNNNKVCGIGPSDDVKRALNNQDYDHCGSICLYNRNDIDNKAWVWDVNNLCWIPTTRARGPVISGTNCFAIPELGNVKGRL